MKIRVLVDWWRNFARVYDDCQLNIETLCVNENEMIFGLFLLMGWSKMINHIQKNLLFKNEPQSGMNANTASRDKNTTHSVTVPKSLTMVVWPG